MQILLYNFVLLGLFLQLPVLISSRQSQSSDRKDKYTAALRKRQGDVWYTIECNPKTRLPSEYSSETNVVALVLFQTINSFRLPNGLAVTAYDTWTKFCAATTTGGLQESNMGGHCPNQVIMVKKPEPLVFGGNFGDYRIASVPELMALCRRKCRCASSKGSTDLGRLAEHVLEQYDLWEAVDAVKKYRARVGNGNLEVTADGLQLIERLNTPDATSSNQPPPVQQQCDLTASRRCQNFRCGQSVDDGKQGGLRCACIAGDFDRKTMLYTFAGCGLIARTMNIGLSRPVLSLNGRNIAGGEVKSNEEQNQPACPCNGTYVSVACCWSNEGLVWETTDMKLGELHSDLM